MLTSAQIPELIIWHVSTPADNPLCISGASEGGALGPNAALPSAIGDALGIDIDHIPITLSRLGS